MQEYHVTSLYQLIMEYHHHKLQVRKCRQPCWHKTYIYALLIICQILYTLCISYFVHIIMHLTGGLQRAEEICLRVQTKKSTKARLKVRSKVYQSNPKYIDAFSTTSHCLERSYFINTPNFYQLIINNFFYRQESRGTERRNDSSKIIPLQRSRTDLNTDV